MKLTLIKYLYSVLFVAFIPLMTWGNVEKRNFTLVIDAGHGGHDAGAVGAFSKEKNINLNVALAFGKLVEENCPDVKVVYTRKTDVFIPLQRRADIANSCKADLFVSVHTNALPNGRIAYGSETYTLGMARASANLAVAKRENSVITLESDYKSTYQGFDPNKAESYVIFEFMQDKFMKQSVDLASCIQKQYTSAGRQNKGVHQAGFLVLRNTSMPSVLTELGFITTPAEETYLNSPQGVMELSRSIYNGFLAYRRLHERGAHDIPENLPVRMTADLPNTQASEPTTVAEPIISPTNSKDVAVVPVPTVPTARVVQTPKDDDTMYMPRPTSRKTTSRPTVTVKKENQVGGTAPTNTTKEKVTATAKEKTDAKAKENNQPKVVPKPKEVVKEKDATKSATTKETAAANKNKKAETAKPVANSKETKTNKPTATDKNKKAETTKPTTNSKETKTNKPTATDKSKKESVKEKSETATTKGKQTANSKTKETQADKKNSTQKAASKDKDTKAATNKKDNTATTKQRVSYRIQVGAGKTGIEANDPQFKGLSVSRVKEGTMYKYFYGSYATYAEAQKALHTVRGKLSTAYVVAYVNGKSVSVAEARAKEQEKK